MKPLALVVLFFLTVTHSARCEEKRSFGEKVADMALNALIERGVNEAIDRLKAGSVTTDQKAYLREAVVNDLWNCLAIDSAVLSLGGWVANEKVKNAWIPKPDGRSVDSKDFATRLLVIDVNTEATGQLAAANRYLKAVLDHRAKVGEVRIGRIDVFSMIEDNLNAVKAACSMISLRYSAKPPTAEAEREIEMKLWDAIKAVEQKRIKMLDGL